MSEFSPPRDLWEYVRGSWRHCVIALALTLAAVAFFAVVAWGLYLLIALLHPG